MKFFAFLVVAIFAVTMVLADPINISQNTVGDVVSVNIDANAVVSSNIEQNILSILLGVLNQQAAVVGQGQ